MDARALFLTLTLALYGCGDDGRGGGDGDGSPEDDGETSGVFPSGGTGEEASSSGDPDPGDDGSGASGSGSSATTGGDPGDTGTSCQEIWDCYEGCQDTDCTVACYEAGSGAAKALDDALWECIFVEHCGYVDWGCVQEHCAAEQQACFGG